LKGKEQTLNSEGRGRRLRKLRAECTSGVLVGEIRNHKTVTPSKRQVSINLAAKYNQTIQITKRMPRWKQQIITEQ